MQMVNEANNILVVCVSEAIRLYCAHMHLQINLVLTWPDWNALKSHQTIFLMKSWGLGKDGVVQKKTKRALITNMEMEVQEMITKMHYAHAN